MAAAGADSDKWQLNHGVVIEQAEGLAAEPTWHIRHGSAKRDV